MIRKLGELFSSSELGGHTYCFFVLACSYLTSFGTEAAMERHERVVSGAPRVLEMKAEVSTVTLHRSFTQLETAKPRTAQSRCAPLRASPRKFTPPSRRSMRPRWRGIPFRSKLM